MPTGISYVDETWNPVVGCTKCSLGCLNCYAERMAIRLNGIFAAKGDIDNWADYSSILKWDYEKAEMGKAIGWNGEVALRPGQLNIPPHWRKPRTILVPSMGDYLHPNVPDEFIYRMFDIARQCPQHKLLFLTKRIGRLWEMYSLHPKRDWPPSPNIHFGVTICTQKEADEILPIALQISGFDWVSFEPLLEGIDFSDYMREYLGSETCSYGDMHQKRKCECIFLEKLKWTVIGCESGPKRRPCKLEHIRSIVDQCKAAGVGCYVKQMEIDGKVSHNPDEWPKWAQVRDEIC